MYKNVDQNFINTVTQSGRTFKARAIFNTFTFEDEIKGYNLTQGDTELTVGGAYSSALELVVFGQHENLKNQRFTLEIGLLVNNEYVFIPVGKFVVKIAALKSDITEISASDYMYLLEKKYSTDLEFPATIDQVTKEILDFVGIAYTGDFATDKFILYTPINYSMREMLGLCASVQGTNAYFDRYGALMYQWYTPSEFIANDEQIKDPTIYDTDFSIKYFEVDNEGTIMLAGDEDSDTGIFISNAFFIQTYVDEVFDKIENFTFRPAELSFILGNPLFDPWDVITYKNWQIPCMQMEFNFDGGLWCDLTTYVQDVDKEYSSPAEREQEREESELSNAKLILDEFNKSDVTLGTEQTLFTIEFTTKEENLPVFECTGQVQTTVECVVVFDVVVDGSLLFSYKNTVGIGYRVINFIIPLKDLHQGGHNVVLSAYTESKIDSGVILSGHAKGIVWGDGLLAISKWNGIIQLDEVLYIEFPHMPIDIVERVQVQQQIPQKGIVNEVLNIEIQPVFVQMVEDINVIV